MKFICAGLPKTGTKSMAEALRILGFKVHDVPQHIEYHMAEYTQALKGKMPDFVSMLNNVDATTDFPSSYLWKEIKESFPDAKVILTERDDIDSWISSLQGTHALWDSIMTRGWLGLGRMMTPKGRKWRELDKQYNKLMRDDGDEKLPQKYNEHNARVKATIPRDELLVFNVKQGWKPLCEFLGVDVPDVPFPRVNVKSGAIPDMVYNSKVAKQVFNELILILTILFILVAILVFLVVS